MKKILKIQVLLSIVIILFFFNFNVSTTKAAFSDKDNGLYHKLSEIVYDADNLKKVKKKLTDAHYPEPKFKVLDVLDIDNDKTHPIGKTANGKGIYGLQSTGFKAMAVLEKSSNNVIIAFAGTQKNNPNDVLTAINSLTSTTSGQSFQAQLYMNYIFKAKLDKDKKYKFYLTGHSLGGWVSTKLYLDIRSANWLTSKTKFEYGGAIIPSISGVYTFNPLPISKKSISSEQWKANKNRVYDKDVKNLYIKNEWLNSTQQGHSDSLAYIGTQGAINKKITRKNYVTTGIKDTLIHYYTKDDMSESHKICKLKNSVTPINQSCGQ
ncbi:hypothetical protein MHI18_05125 [Peribacillus sp. FSL H8-0477]|uniref:hypothetical protein n=1 Tax=Peribacillus sp. FSL H8-0477 TaxID=2921388 RepID=UPI0030F6DF1E